MFFPHRLALAALVALSAPATAGLDPYNPTCPDNPGWATNPQMRFTLKTIEGFRVLMAEGVIEVRDRATGERIEVPVADAAAAVLAAVRG